MNIQDSSSAALRKRRHHLARRLPPIEQILRGSLIETYNDSKQYLRAREAEAMCDHVLINGWI